MTTDYTQILPTGKQNAVKSDELMRITGFHSIRAMRADIARSRTEGQIIACDTQTGGYYLPADREELTEFVKIIEARAKSTLYMLKSAKRKLQEYDGQCELDLSGTIRQPDK